MSTSEKAVRDIVRVAVENHVRHELPYFTRLARADDSWVLWNLRRRRRSGPVGIGPSEIATVTGVLWIALNQAALEFGTAAGNGVFAAFWALVCKLLRLKPKNATIRLLRDEQLLKLVHDSVFEQLKNKTKLSDERCADIANAVYYQLSSKPDAPGATKVDPASPEN
jgi:hypothetical protein